jgi:hypothetical protein
MKRSAVLFCALLSLSFATAGCGGSPSVDQVRWELQRRFPEARFQREARVRLGRISLGLIRGVVRMVPGEVEGQQFLNAVHRVDVATYRVSSLPDLDRIQGDTRFADQLADAGWTMVVRTREADENAWVYLRSDEAGIMRSLFVVALETDELTLVRLDGRLDQALVEAIAREPKRAARTIKEDGERAEGAEDAEEDDAEPAGGV